MQITNKCFDNGDAFPLYSQRSGVFWGRGRAHLRNKLAKAGNRVKTTDDFITGIASKSYLPGKPYLAKFSDGHTQLTGNWLRAHLAETLENKR